MTKHNFYTKMVNYYVTEARAAYDNNDLNLYHKMKRSGEELIDALNDQGYTVTYDEATDTYTVSK